MGDVLIIRSVSFQQLDLNLPAIRQAFSGHRLVLLTHGHGLKLAETYQDIAEVLVYPGEGAFAKAALSHTLLKRPFEAVLVPVTNSSGAGFFNVFELAFALQAKQVQLCNVRSEIRPLGPQDIATAKKKHILFSILAGMASVFAGLAALPYLLWKLPGLESKEK